MAEQTDQIEWRVVASTHVNAVSYDDDTHTLSIVFNDSSVWEYADVPPGVFEGLLTTPSVGTYMHKIIKPNYTATKIF